MKSIEAILAMGGYAAYVWSAYGIAALVLIGNVFLTLRQKRQTLRLIKKRLQLEMNNHASKT